MTTADMGGGCRCFLELKKDDVLDKRHDRWGKRTFFVSGCLPSENEASASLNIRERIQYLLIAHAWVEGGAFWRDRRGARLNFFRKKKGRSSALTTRVPPGWEEEKTRRIDRKRRYSHSRRDPDRSTVGKGKIRKGGRRPNRNASSARRAKKDKLTKALRE